MLPYHNWIMERISPEDLQGLLKNPSIEGSSPSGGIFLGIIYLTT